MQVFALQHTLEALLQEERYLSFGHSPCRPYLEVVLDQLVNEIEYFADEYLSR